MKKLICGAGIALALLLATGTAVASKEVCQRQQDAAPNLVNARDGDVKKEDVIAEVRKAASSKESADVLSESVELIYANKSIDIGQALKLVYDRCIAALGE